MENFIISPEDCLILKAFKTSNSLREAAKLLNCDPTGLQRKTQRICDEHGYLQKINGRWTLTEAGLLLAAWVDESIDAQKKLLSSNSVVKISSTMWLVEQFLIPHLELLKSKLPKNNKLQLITPSNHEEHLKSGACDFVIVCHPPEDPAIAHKQLFKEQWVVVAPAHYKKSGQKLEIAQITTMPFIRHDQINPDIFHFNAANINQNTVLTVDSLIAVRSAILHGTGWSVVPRILVSDLIKEKRMVEIKHDIDMDRKMCLWWLRTRTDSKKLSSSVAQFLQEAHAKMI